MGRVFKGSDKGSSGAGIRDSVASATSAGAAAESNQRRSSVNQMNPDTAKLPETFNLKAVKRNPTDKCMLCEAPFTNKIRLLNRNPIRHCKRCGKSICEVCSD